MKNHPIDRTHIDMSQEAVDQRLRDVAELYRLGMSLKTAVWLGKASDVFPGKETAEPGQTQNVSQPAETGNDISQ